MADDARVVCRAFSCGVACRFVVTRKKRLQERKGVRTSRPFSFLLNSFVVACDCRSESKPRSKPPGPKARARSGRAKNTTLNAIVPRPKPPHNQPTRDSKPTTAAFLNHGLKVHVYAPKSLRDKTTTCRCATNSRSLKSCGGIPQNSESPYPATNE